MTMTYLRAIGNNFLSALSAIPYMFQMELPSNPKQPLKPRHDNGKYSYHGIAPKQIKYTDLYKYAVRMRELIGLKRNFNILSKVTGRSAELVFNLRASGITPLRWTGEQVFLAYDTEGIKYMCQLVHWLENNSEVDWGYGSAEDITDTNHFVYVVFKTPKSQKKFRKELYKILTALAY